MNPRYLIGRHKGKDIPFIKVFEIVGKDGRSNTHIAFRETHHHYSLHEAMIISESTDKFTVRQDNQETEYPKHYTGNKPIHYTSFDTDKQVSVWDNEIEEIATILQLSDAKKHIKYYENRILPLGSQKSFYLGGRKILLSKINKIKQYPTNQCVLLDVQTDSFFVETEFFVDEPTEKNDVLLQISIGWLRFRIR